MEPSFIETLTWIFEWTKNWNVYWCHQEHLFRTHWNNWLPSIFDLFIHVIDSKLVFGFHCTQSLKLERRLNFRFLLRFDWNSDCNVWMTLGSQNDWNKFTFLWCIDTSQNSWHNIPSIVYARWSLNQSKLSVGFIAWEKKNWLSNNNPNKTLFRSHIDVLWHSIYSRSVQDWPVFFLF